MGSALKLKNTQDQEFAINHLDNAGAISINSSDIATLSGNQTVTGEKTFTSSPIVPTPTAGDRTTKVATTKLFDDEFVKSLSGNGYQKLPSGLIIQWQQHTTINGTNTVTFPIAFTNSCLASIISLKQVTLGTASIYSYTSTQATVTANFAGTTTVISIGF